MKILKYLFFLILIFIIGASIYVATKKGDFMIEEKQTIKAPQEMVFNEVNDLTTWKNWEPWSKESEDMIISYGDKTNGAGASYSWNSEEMGDGELKTVKANPLTDIEQKITFKTPLGESTSDVYWNFEAKEDSTIVTWGMKGEQSFMEKLAFIFQDQSISEMMKPKFQEGLGNLAEVIREEMQSYSINVDGITNHGGGYYMYTATASKISQVSDKMDDMFSDVKRYMDDNGIEKGGNPFILYNERNQTQGTVIYSAGYFTPSEVVTPEDSPVLTGFLPNQRTLKVTLKGDYENLQEAWKEASTYISANELLRNNEAQPFEVYIAGPNDNTNPAKWITQLYIPLMPEGAASETKNTSEDD